MKSRHPIFDLIEQDRTSNVFRLLKNDPSCIHARDLFEHTPLTFACSLGKDIIIRKLLSFPDIDVNAKNVFGNTALMFAIKNDISLNILELLRQKGADLNAVNHHDNNPILWACYCVNPDILRWLILHGAVVDFIHKEGQDLHTLIQRKRIFMEADFILKHGIFLSEKNKARFRALRLEQLFQ